MDELSIELETITPLCIAGGDPAGNIVSEGLRPSTVRGLLRWWFRAVLWGAKVSSLNTQDDEEILNTIKKIKDDENAIWGSTERRSQVRIRTLPVGKVGYARMQSIVRDPNRTGLRYLSYGVHNREYIREGSKFKLIVSFGPNAEDECKKKVVATLWLLFNLGNFGSKCRKGFGSIMVTNTQKIYELEFNPQGEKLTNYLSKNLCEVLKIFGAPFKPQVNPPPIPNALASTSQVLPPFSVIQPNFWYLKILEQNYDTWQEGIDEMGKKLREYREDKTKQHTTRTTRDYSYYVTKDYDCVKSVFEGNKKGNLFGSIFGLPHQFQFRSIGKRAIVKGEKSERRASPLYIKIWKVGGKYIVGLQLFKSKFLSNYETQLSIEPLESGQSNKKCIPSYDIIEKFIMQHPGEVISLC